MVGVLVGAGGCGDGILVTVASGSTVAVLVIVGASVPVALAFTSVKGVEVTGSASDFVHAAISRRVNRKTVIWYFLLDMMTPWIMTIRDALCIHYSIDVL